MSALTIKSQETTDDFSLVIGGPLFQMFRRAYLPGTLELLRRRIIVIITMLWLPLLMLEIWEGYAWGKALA